MYRIEFDDGTGILTLTYEGFWTRDVMTTFIAELSARSLDILRRHDHFDVLNDTRNFPVQSSEVSEGLAMIDRLGQEMNSGRVALVTSSALAKMQAQRVTGDPRIRIFMDMDEARAWLATPAETDGKH